MNWHIQKTNWELLSMLTLTIQVKVKIEKCSGVSSVQSHEVEMQ